MYLLFHSLKSEGLKVASQLIGEDALAAACLEGGQGAVISEAVGHVLIHSVGGVLGGALHGAFEAVKGDKEPSTPKAYTGEICMVVGPTKVGFFSLKGLWYPQIDQLLAAYLRSEISHLEVRGGVIPKVNVTLSDGTNFKFDCKLDNLRKAKKIASIIGKP
jgi:hypothetical protein